MRAVTCFIALWECENGQVLTFSPKTKRHLFGLRVFVCRRSSVWVHGWIVNLSTMKTSFHIIWQHNDEVIVQLIIIRSRGAEEEQNIFSTKPEACNNHYYYKYFPYFHSLFQWIYRLYRLHFTLLSCAFPFLNLFSFC